MKHTSETAKKICPACCGGEKRTLNIESEMPHLEIGDRVKLRGDMGSFTMKIRDIKNDWFVECSFWGTKRHINALFLRKI